MILSENIFYMLLSGFTFGITFTVLLVIGWFFCADYYYKVYNILDEVGLFVIYFMSILVSIIFTAFYIKGDYNAMTMILVMYNITIACALLLVFFNFIIPHVHNMRKHFATKRGRTL